MTGKHRKQNPVLRKTTSIFGLTAASVLIATPAAHANPLNTLVDTATNAAPAVTAAIPAVTDAAVSYIPADIVTQATSVAGIGDVLNQAGSSTAESIPAPTNTNAGAASSAESQTGTPYVWGGSQPGGFDCSGLIKWAYEQIGKNIPRTSQDQMAAGVPVSLDNLQPGDIIGYYSGNSHVGIYVGNGQVVHAPTSGDVVKYAGVYDMPVTGAVRY